MRPCRVSILLRPAKQTITKRSWVFIERGVRIETLIFALNFKWIDLFLNKSRDSGSRFRSPGNRIVRDRYVKHGSSNPPNYSYAFQKIILYLVRLVLRGFFAP
jgi:hypothetical protein